MILNVFFLVDKPFHNDWPHVYILIKKRSEFIYLLYCILVLVIISLESLNPSKISLQPLLQWECPFFYFDLAGKPKARILIIVFINKMSFFSKVYQTL